MTVNNAHFILYDIKDNKRGKHVSLELLEYTIPWESYTHYK